MKSKEKIKMVSKNNLGNLLIIIGILLIAIPLIGWINHSGQQQKEIDEFMAQVQQQQYEALSNSLDWGANKENAEVVISNEANVLTDVEEIKNKISVINSNSFSEQRLEENGEVEEEIIEQDTVEEEKKVEVVKPTTIALIEIPSIAVVLPIAEGVDVFTLNYCVGHMPGSADLGEIGNSVLAGHRGYTYGTYFNKLDEVNLEDIIKITTSDGSVYSYKVFDSFVVEPDDVTILEQNQDEKIITLITCHPKVISSHRLIVQGELIE